MSKRILFSAVVLAILSTAPANAQSKPTPSPTPRLEPSSIPINEKAIYIQSSLGPFGEAYIPPEILAQKDFFRFLNDGKLQFASDNFFFPSIYFTVSAKPYIELKSNKDRSKDNKHPDYEFTKKGENLNWMRVTITIAPVLCDCKDDDDCVGGLKGREQDNYLKILSIVPEETTSSSKENPLTTIGSVGDALINKLLPFVYAEEHPTTQNASAEYSAASGAVSILFKNLFPPKTVPNNYSFIDGDVEEYVKKAGVKDDDDCEKRPVGAGEDGNECIKRVDKFGWFWKRGDDPNNIKSIIGIRRSVAFLQIRRGIKGIKVKYRIEAKWDSDYSRKIDDEYADISNFEQEFSFDKANCFPPSKPKPFYERTDYQMLSDLDGFPVVIPKEVVCQIFRRDTGEPSLRVDDIPSVSAVLTKFETTGKGTLASIIWDRIKEKVSKRYEAGDKKIDRKQAIAGIKEQRLRRKPNETQADDQAFKKILSDEINRLYSSDEFYELFKTLLPEKAAQELDRLRLHGETREIWVVFRRKIDLEFAKLIRPLSDKSQCDAWFATSPFDPKNVETQDGQAYVHREAVKSRLGLPLLRDLLRDMILPKVKVVP